MRGTPNTHIIARPGPRMGDNRLLLSGLAVLAAPVESQSISLLPGRSETLTFATDIGTALIVDPDTADVEVLDARNLARIGLHSRNHSPRRLRH